MDYLDAFIQELLHLDDVRGNRLLDIGKFGVADGGKSGRAYRLFAPNGGENSKVMLQVIKSRRGKPSNKTVLDGSALVRSAVDNPLVEKWEWSDLAGNKDSAALDGFISDVYNALDLKGNNPLFLGVGNLNWTVAAGDEIKPVNSPLLIFPIRFVRGTNTSPVEIEFVDDDAYFNPCLIGRMQSELSPDISANFPHPNGVGASFDEPIDLDKLGDGEEYMKLVAAYAAALGERVSFDKNVIVVAQYSHSDICMYYDVRRNKQKIYSHPLVARIFGGGAKNDELSLSDGDRTVRPVLPVDSVQEKLIADIAAGKSLIVKGPPGTGKTLTIANILATLLAQGKSVLVASEKLSALAEVHAKLPERLRKFVMLLDYETEQKAAAVNPSEVRAEFKRLIKTKREFVYDSANDIKYQRADRAKAEAMLALADYCGEVFGSDVAWGSYYDALDTFFAGADLPVIPFADSGAAAAISREDYNKLLLAVGTAASHFARMAESGSVHDCPWLGVSEAVDSERAMQAMSEIAAVMTDIDRRVRSAAADRPDLPWDECTYGDIHDAALPNILTAPDMRKALAALEESDGEAVETFMDSYERAVAAVNIKLDLGKASEEAQGGVAACTAAEQLDCAFIRDVALAADVFTVHGQPLSEQTAQNYIKIVGDIADLTDEKQSLFAETVFVLDKAAPGDAELLKACRAIAPYADGKKQSVGLLDLKAKSAEKKLRAVCSRSGILLKDLASAAVKYARIAECDGDIAQLGSLLSAVIARPVSPEQFDTIVRAVKTSRACGKALPELVELCGKAHAAISALGDIDIPIGCTAGEVIANIKAHRAEKTLTDVMRAVCGKAEIDVAADIYKQAQSLSSLLRVKYSAGFDGSADNVIAFVELCQSAGADCAQAIVAAVEKLKAFGEKYFGNMYTRAPWHVTLGRAQSYVRLWRDRAMLNAALAFDKAVRGDNALPLDAFFAPVTAGKVDVGADRFADMFVHSYTALAIANKLNKLGNKRNGLAKNAELAVNDFLAAEAELYECNAAKIENLCLARINADDDDFDFLAIDKGISMSLRAMFRRHARAILKLKKCFILSPSTASVLLRGEAYENFDVVIVDEASQMPPVDILPVLYRSKQCVLVGDEFQMPPLTHFKVKNRKRISDPESELTLDTDISALSLALGNLAFDSEELVCHYRSKTETLIRFSQELFYPYMRTFPTTVPATPDLGFTDIHTPDGCCEDGVNTVEGKEVIKALNAHFDRYYDPKTERLSVAVGVVTFGEKQLKYVKSLVAADRALSQKMENAWRKFDDVPDKLIFFRTIESVQGQETDHLILSLTYGKDKNGNVKLAFGELNRDATGKNIFNVAVTRARSRITVIHSVTAEQLMGNPRIEFIQKYLACARRYAEKGKGQFVSAPPEKGESFIRSVADYIRSLGVAEERIVINYGVTDGSVRIPVAVLSPSLDRAELGVWCECPTLKKYDFFDYNARYYATLEGRGWALCRVFAHDWLDNADAEKQALKKQILNHVTL